MRPGLAGRVCRARAGPGGMTSRAVRTADILNGRVRLDVQCLDRIYLNGYVPTLQVVAFLASRGYPIPSPAVVGRIAARFQLPGSSPAVLMSPSTSATNFRIKEYFEQGRALRIETVVNDTTDLGVKRRLGPFVRTPSQGP